MRRRRSPSSGGYVREVIDKEGSEIAGWFAERGVTVFVLKYRLPGEGHAHVSFVPSLLFSLVPVAASVRNIDPTSSCEGLPQRPAQSCQKLWTPDLTALAPRLVAVITEGACSCAIHTKTALFRSASLTE